MTPEQSVLVILALGSFGFALLTILTHNATLGGASLRGNRDGQGPLRGALGCIVRAHENHNATLLPFAILVAVAAATSTSTALAANCAEVFLASRIAYAALYVGGVPILRSLAYYAGLGAAGVYALALPWP